MCHCQNNENNLYGKERAFNFYYSKILKVVYIYNYLFRQDDRYKSVKIFEF